MIRVENSVIISRPLEEVFAYGTHFSNMPDWNNTVLAVQDYQGGASVGTTFTQISTFLGKKMEQGVRVTEYRQNEMFVMESTSGPVSSHITVTFEAHGSGTKITEVIEGESGGFFRLAEPLLKRALTRQRASDLATLKDLLEYEGEIAAAGEGRTH